MLLILTVVLAVNHMDRQLLALLIEPISQEFALSDAAAGLLYGFAFAVFFSLLAVPLAWCADRSNRVRLIAACTVVFSVMTALCGAAAAFWQLLLARIGVAAGEAGTTPASHSLLADLYPFGRRSTAMAAFAIGPHVGVVLAFVFGGVIAQRFGWRSAFIAAGALGLIIALWARLSLAEPARVHADAHSGSLSDAARDVRRCASMRRIFTGFAIANMAASALVAWLPAWLMRVHQFGIAEAGFVLAGVLGVLGGVGVFFGGVLADRLGRDQPARRLQICAIGLLGAALLWAVALLHPVRAMAFTALALAGALVSFHLGPSFAMVQSLSHPRRRALTASLMLLIVNLVGLGLGPLLAGWLSDIAAALGASGSVRYGLLSASPLFAVAAYAYWSAARTLEEDLRCADRAVSL